MSSQSLLSPLSDLLPSFHVQFESLGQWVFFRIIFDFLDNEILAFRETMVHEMTTWVASLSAILMTLWIATQGYRILTGQSRDPMMGLLVSSLRNVMIVIAATTLMVGSTNIYDTLGSDLPRAITKVVTGKDQDPADTIDRGLSKMQLAMAAIDALPALDNPGIKEDKDRALLLTGIGVAGPAVVGGALLVMYKFAMALFVGLGPLFILSLMFDQTKAMFPRWLQYGVGTMFSMAVLSFTVTVSMKIVAGVAGNFAGQYLVMMAAGDSASAGVNTMALQQGGLGIFLTVLIVSIPPMAANFFQGAVGSFMHYSAFGADSTSSKSQAPGQSGYRPEMPGGSEGQRGSGQNQHANSGNPGTPYGGISRPNNERANTHANDRVNAIASQKNETKQPDDHRL